MRVRDRLLFEVLGVGDDLAIKKQLPTSLLTFVKEVCDPMLMLLSNEKVLSKACRV